MGRLRLLSGATWGVLGALWGSAGGPNFRRQTRKNQIAQKCVRKMQKRSLVFRFFLKTVNTTTIWLKNWKRACFGRPWALLGAALGGLGGPKALLSLRFKGKLEKSRKNGDTKSGNFGTSSLNFGRIWGALLGTPMLGIVKKQQKEEERKLRRGKTRGEDKITEITASPSRKRFRLAPWKGTGAIS